ncbi:unnamed protein product [Prorocentrum cordatum]|uniref:Protein-tyrosine sulfotransferase n=1 Tax=Prorocentrum cordatum TaxID=2364126 RepID=A0ABN9PH24_9DINO|nr:unnamed protein product [Polarella glacialis]|mmetsp:Transcript_54240/g.141332  ORF Transcript_54240/g.141332 Transcript_54240/m.141332 type:complete len:316 (-) Transcript_54240:55-1002(-)
MRLSLLLHLPLLLGRLHSTHGRNLPSTIFDAFFRGGASAEQRSVGGLAVIGAGASRTGTQSITEALHVLGLPVYNLVGIMQHRHTRAATLALQQPGTFTRPLIEEVLSLGYRATMDTPMNMLWRDQLEVFPDSKVLLSVRDTTEDWKASTLWAGNALGPFHKSRPWKWIVDLGPLLQEVSVYYWRGGGGEDFGCKRVERMVQPWWAPWVEYVDMQELDGECLGRYYESLRAEVEATVPAEKLLVFNVKEGWGPLCAFLNVSVPSQPFPRVNSSREMTAAYYLLRVVCWVYPLALICPVALLGFCLRRCMAKRKTE